MKIENVFKLEIVKEIEYLKKIKNAVILSHYYQNSDIQDVADFIGDSLYLAQKARETDASIIIFAGVHFMAETAKILNPEKKVVIPNIEAGCSLADSCKYEDLKLFVKKYNDYKIVSYINCSAEVKSISDIICTSSNAIKIIESFEKEQKIIFVPDRNLGSYINSVTGRNMLLWDGVCEIHDNLELEKVIKLKEKYPEAKLISHPECKSCILEISDFIGSTSALLNFTKIDKCKEFIVATETGIIYQMKHESPYKNFIIVPRDETCSCNDCSYMKKNTLENLYECIRNEKPEINLSNKLIEKSRIPIIKMLELSKE